MSVLKVILGYFKHHKFQTFLIIFTIVLVTLLALLPAQILRIIIDEYLDKNSNRKLLYIALVYAATFILVGIVGFIKSLVMLSTSQKITAELKCKMMQHVHKLSYKSIVNTDTGTLEAYFNNDVNAINELFTSGVVNMITDLFKMIGIVISIIIYSYLFGIIVIAVLPILVLFTSFVKKKMLKAQLRTKALEGNVNKVLLENIENIETIKVNKALAYSTGKYENILLNHYKTSQASNLYDAIFSPIMQIIRYIVVCAILLICGYDSSIFGMTIGMVVSGITLITDLFSPIESLGMEIQTIQKSVAAVKRINGFFQMETDETKGTLTPKNLEIVFDNVSFAYNDEEVIKNFNYTIEMGDKIALQGPSGSGKSTLMKLAMGLLQPTKGRVTIGGVDTYLLNDETRKNIFSIVYQDSFFSGGTVYEEISLLDNNIAPSEVRKALNLVGLDYITDLDQILNSKEYSSGELALFNIARVVVRNTSIIFLDEMNARIDPLTGKSIINLINQVSRGKIVISINHYGDILENAKVIHFR